MVDYLKADVLGMSPDVLKSNGLLDFNTQVSIGTGVLGSFAQAFYNGLKFRVYEPTDTYPMGRVTIEGSLHKYWNDGRHNYNDFSLKGIHQALSDIQERFSISPQQISLRQLELGLNLSLDHSPEAIIKNMMFHRTDRICSPIPSHRGTYFHVARSQKVLKWYNKSKHMNSSGIKAPENLFRMENKYLKMAEINRMGIYTLSDLICADLPCLVENILLREWEGVIYYDERALEGHKHKEQYGNLRFWEGLKYENFKYHRKQLKMIYADKPQCVKEIIRRKIIDKCRQLNDHTTEIDTLCIR